MGVGVAWGVPPPGIMVGARTGRGLGVGIATVAVGVEVGVGIGVGVPWAPSSPGNLTWPGASVGFGVARVAPPLGIIVGAKAGTGLGVGIATLAVRVGVGVGIGVGVLVGLSPFPPQEAITTKRVKRKSPASHRRQGLRFQGRLPRWNILTRISTSITCRRENPGHPCSQVL